MTHAIWQDLLTRMQQLRSDMVIQWTGEIDNAIIERGVGALGHAIEAWKIAEPFVAPIAGPTVMTAEAGGLESA